MTPTRSLLTIAAALLAGFLVAAPPALAGGPSDPPTGGGPGAGGPGEPVPVDYDVTTAGEFQAALAAVRPGQRIRLAPGTYSGAFLARTPGTEDAPIVLFGEPGAVITNPGPSGTNPGCSVPAEGFNPGYGLWLYGADWWTINGVEVANASKGIVVDASQHVTLTQVDVHDIGDEGVHFRRSSADGALWSSRIENTGKVQPQYGEGVYVGSANSNWACYGNTGGVDRSDRVQVLYNQVGPGVAAEHVDVKEGTVGGQIIGNSWNGQGIAGQNSADSWVDMKGSDYLLQYNVGTFAPPGVFANGYETHNPVAGSGCGNVWRDNESDLGGAGKWAVNVTSVSKCAGNPNVVHASNTVTNATSGLTNIAVTP